MKTLDVATRRPCPLGALLTGALLSLSLLVAPIDPASAQDADTSVTVGLYESPLFVMFTEAGTPVGFAIDLWTHLSDDLGLASEFVTFDTLRTLTEAVERGEVDVAVTNLTITEERHRRMDFTQPWFDAGLRIMVVSDGSSGIRAVINGLSDAGHLMAYGMGPVAQSL